MSTIKRCRCCGKEIAFYWKEPTTYRYKDQLGYYCSYNCFREKGLLKDKILNVSCLGKEKELAIKELTMKYFMNSGDTGLSISNLRAIDDICSQKDLDILLANKKVKEYYIRVKKLKEKHRNEDSLCLGK